MDVSPVNAPISFFNEQNQRGNVILSPKYQRRLMWPFSHKVYLIDTILKGLPLPKFFVQIKVDLKTGKSVYYVVDGQQRMNAIFEFIEGKTKDGKPFELTKKHYPFPERFDEELEGLNFQKLPKPLQEKFWSYNLTSDQLRNANENEITDMFVRINKNNVRLNDQELRNALFEGDFKKLAYSLAEDTGDFWLDNKIIPLTSIRRMGDAEYVSELLISILYGIQDKKKKLDKYYADNEEMDEKDKANLKRSFNKILNIVDDIFTEHSIKTTRFKNKNDFYSLFYVIQELLKEGHKFNIDLNEIKKILIEINNEARLESKNPRMVKYYEVTVNSPDSESNRKFRCTIIKELIKPLLIKTDERRFFTETQKQFIWHRHENKICSICNKKVEKYEDYEPDHIKPWSKGGLTTIENGQISHCSCNRSKKDRI